MFFILNNIWSVKHDQSIQRIGIYPLGGGRKIQILRRLWSPSRNWRCFKHFSLSRTHTAVIETDLNWVRNWKFSVILSQCVILTFADKLTKDEGVRKLAGTKGICEPHRADCCSLTAMPMVPDSNFFYRLETKNEGVGRLRWKLLVRIPRLLPRKAAWGRASHGAAAAETQRALYDDALAVNACCISTLADCS